MSDAVLVVGTGLIGTSLGLALRGHRDVLLADRSAEHLATAVARGAGRAWDGTEAAALVVLAVPPSVLPMAYREVRGVLPDAVVTHVSSIQSQVLAALRKAGADEGLLCGGHPLAGRETSGPGAATAGLFAGRPWVLCPTEATTADTEAAVHELAVACGATPVVMGADEHDRSVALVSHLPHLAATAVAAQLIDDDAAVSIGGPGLQDTTRVAAGDPELWVQILTGNAAFVAPVVRAAAADLSAVADALAAGDASAVRDLLARGQRGRALVPVKRGDHDADFTRLSVSVPDAPGQLAAIFGRAAQADVNIEDVRVEHLPGRPTGLLELLVHVAERGRLKVALEDAGFTVLPDA